MNFYALQFTSRVLSYKEHTVKINGIGELFEIYKITYWPSLKAKRLNVSDMESEGNWIVESDGIGGIRYFTNDLNCVVMKKIGCSKFWVFGSKDSSLSKFTVSFGDLEDEINENIEDSLIRKNNELIYESFELDYDLNNLIFTSHGPALINCIYYEYENNLSPTSSPTQSQSRSQIQSQTQIQTQFFSTFSETNEFHQNESFSSKIYSFSNSFQESVGESVNLEMTNDLSDSSIENENENVSSTDKKEKKKKKFTKTDLVLVVVLVEIAIVF